VDRYMTVRAVVDRSTLYRCCRAMSTVAVKHAGRKSKSISHEDL